MFKIIANIGEWANIAESRHATPFLRDCYPSNIEISGPTKDGRIWVEPLASAEPEKSVRRHVAALLIDRQSVRKHFGPEGATIIAQAFRSDKVRDHLKNLVESTHRRDASEAISFLNQLTENLDKQAILAEWTQNKHAERRRQRYIMLMSIYAIIIAAATLTYFVTQISDRHPDHVKLSESNQKLNTFQDRIAELDSRLNSMNQSAINSLVNERIKLQLKRIEDADQQLQKNENIEKLLSVYQHLKYPIALINSHQINIRRFKRIEDDGFESGVYWQYTTTIKFDESFKTSPKILLDTDQIRISHEALRFNGISVGTTNVTNKDFQLVVNLYTDPDSIEALSVTWLAIDRFYVEGNVE